MITLFESCYVCVAHFWKLYSSCRLSIICSYFLLDAFAKERWWCYVVALPSTTLRCTAPYPTRRWARQCMCCLHGILCNRMLLTKHALRTMMFHCSDDYAMTIHKQKSPILWSKILAYYLSISWLWFPLPYCLWIFCLWSPYLMLCWFLVWICCMLLDRMH